MKKIYSLAAVALLTVVSNANAQQAAPDACAPYQAANAATIAKTQAAKTPAERVAIVKAASEANPAFAYCLTDMALQMALVGVEPAAGPDDVTGQDFTGGTGNPVENPNQLNEGTGGTPGSPSVPAAPSTPEA